MRPETLIDSIRWRPQRSIAEDLRWALASAAVASILSPLLGAAIAYALIK
jgi:hypothetical protein